MTERRLTAAQLRRLRNACGLNGAPWNAAAGTYCRLELHGLVRRVLPLMGDHRAIATPLGREVVKLGGVLPQEVASR